MRGFVWLELARSQALAGDLDAALRSATRAVELRPRSALALVALSNLHHERGEPKPAEELLRRAVDLAPDEPAVLIGLSHSAGARVTMAVALFRLGRQSGAKEVLADIQRWIEKQPATDPELEARIHAARREILGE